LWCPKEGTAVFSFPLFRRSFPSEPRERPIQIGRNGQVVSNGLSGRRRKQDWTCVAGRQKKACKVGLHQVRQEKGVKPGVRGSTSAYRSRLAGARSRPAASSAAPLQRVLGLESRLFGPDAHCLLPADQQTASAGDPVVDRSKAREPAAARGSRRRRVARGGRSRHRSKGRPPAGDSRAFWDIRSPLRSLVKSPVIRRSAR
jgi:hypothetical protein